MKGITWARDSHGLFDYESRHLTKKTMKTEQEVIIMRKQNELSTFQYSKTMPFEEQVQFITTADDDKALLKIVNHNESTFYLESASCNLKNEEDMRAPGQPMTGLINSNENMYLVVRSLKHNNEKIVSFLVISPPIPTKGLRNPREGHPEDRKGEVCREGDRVRERSQQDGRRL